MSLFCSALDFSYLCSMTYQELWNRLTPLYDAGEAKAIARMVLESEFSTFILAKLMNYRQKTSLFLMIFSLVWKKESLCNMCLAKQSLLAGFFM